MLKVGLIGNGGIGGVHLNSYKRLFESGDMEIVAVCDIRSERLKPEFLKGFDNARTYTDIDEMLKTEAKNLDFIDICTPTYLHSEHAIKVMEAGINCLCEKPMARTVEQAEEMLAVSKKTGKLLMLGYCNRFYMGAQEIKKIIDEGKYGKVISADFRREGGSDDGAEWFRDFELSGGATMDFQIHDVDMIRWMFGMPKAVSMTGGNIFTNGGGYDIMSTNFMYDDMFVNATCNWCVPKNRFNVRSIRVNFEEGYVFMDRSVGREVFVLVPKDGEEIDLMDKNVFDPYYEEIKYFASKVRTGEKLGYNLPEESIDSIRLVMAEIQSADCGGARVEL